MIGLYPALPSSKQAAPLCASGEDVANTLIRLFTTAANAAAAGDPIGRYHDAIAIGTGRLRTLLDGQLAPRWKLHLVREGYHSRPSGPGAFFWTERRWCKHIAEHCTAAGRLLAGAVVPSDGDMMKARQHLADASQPAKYLYLAYSPKDTNMEDLSDEAGVLLSSPWRSALQGRMVAA
jgi:hypothetical protein